MSNSNQPTKLDLPIQATATLGFLATIPGKQDDRGNVIGQNGIKWADRRKAV
jgi:hypothetical protein